MPERTGRKPLYVYVSHSRAVVLDTRLYSGRPALDPCQRFRFRKGSHRIRDCARHVPFPCPRVRVCMTHQSTGHVAVRNRQSFGRCTGLPPLISSTDSFAHRRGQSYQSCGICYCKATTDLMSSHRGLSRHASTAKSVPSHTTGM